MNACKTPERPATLSKAAAAACQGRTVMLLAALALAMAPPLSSAQSNVTVFGTLDAGIEYRSNMPKPPAVQVSSALVYSNALGIRGSEDLGSGMKAMFRLEAGFAPDTGMSLQGGRLFGRQSWVGLGDDNNKIALGMMYTPLYDVIGYLDPLQGANTSLWTMDGGMVSRVDKALRYTRSDGAFHVNAQYSFGSDTVGATINGAAGGAARSRESTFAVDYTTAKLMMALVYDNLHGPMTAAQYGTGLYVPSLLPPAPLTPQRAERAVAALRSTWGDTSLFAGYRRLRTTVQETRHDSNLFWTGLTQRFGPSWTATVGAYHQQVVGIDARPSLLVLQAQYRFSKQTGLYTNVSKVWNTRLSNMGVDLQTQTQLGAAQLGVNAGMFYFF